jgi:UDP-N-acetylglucosamine/UDP-N-acetyl-alpha-D-glucosaminouronate 4-epimerase
MKKFIVTGGAGFIGSALVRGLLAQGNAAVEVIDNLSSGHARNLDDLGPHVRLNRADIRDYAAIAPIFDGADTVFHLAAIPSVPRSIDDPVPSHEANIDGTFNVYRACAGAHVRRVVYAGSSSAYGDAETLPKVESMSPRPKSPYAVQKLMGEYYAGAFHGCFGIEAVTLRFFNVYGERQDPGSQYSGIVSLFMKCLLERRPPTIFGDGEQSRDFTYVEDVVSLCLKAAQSQAAVGNVYNAGNGERYTLNQVWRELQQIEGISLAPKYGPDRAGDVRHSQADTVAARRDLGHDPQYTLEQGLRRTLAWYRAAYCPA